MLKFNFSNTELVQLITHKIGNKHKEEPIFLAKELTEVSEESGSLLMEYFLQDFKLPEFYGFSYSQTPNENTIYSYVKEIFASEENLISVSKKLLNIYTNSSEHPNIKTGELNIAYFNNLQLGDEITDGIGIFKSEQLAPYLKMNEQTNNYQINHDYGIEIKKIDKACIIFNTNEEYGYVVLIIDNVNKSNDAQYWKNEFLNVKPLNDDYYNTKEFLTIAKDFVSKQLPEEFEIDRTDKIQLLNRSIDYFKSNERFNKADFEEQVFQDEQLVDSFRNYDQAFRTEHNIQIADEFDISGHAVKKQSRVFKSVLKLDKNFHVYIHGDKNLIEKGTENDGRKFYKIYYENET